MAHNRYSHKYLWRSETTEMITEEIGGGGATLFDGFNGHGAVYEYLYTYFCCSVECIIFRMANNTAEGNLTHVIKD